MLIESFIDYLRLERNYSVRTQQEYRSDLEAFETFFKGQDEELRWETLDIDVVRRWIVDMMDRKQKASSVNRRLSALRSFYRYLLKMQVVKTNPVHTLKGPKKQKPLPVFLKEKTMEQLLDGVFFADDFTGVRDRLILLLFYMTGIRLSELIGLHERDIDMAAELLKVTGKRNKQRMIPFGGELTVQLKAYLAKKSEMLGDDAGEAFFVDEKGVQLTAARVRRIVQQYLSLVTTQKKKSPHVLRHTFATSMLNHNADLEAVKELLGHESLLATEVYTHTTFEELKRVYNKAHPRA